MARKVKAPRPGGKTGKLLILPGEQQWEIWSIPASLNSVFHGLCESPSQAPVSRGASVALPIQQTFCLPIWMINTDPELVREMLILQIEKRGLLAKSRDETVMDFRMVAHADNQALFLSAFLPSSLPESYFNPNLEEYHVSTDFFPLPDNHFVFWIELGRLVVAVTRGNRLVYFQSLSDTTFTPTVIQEIRCIHMQLETVNNIHVIVGASVWGDFSSEDIRPLGQVFGPHLFTQPKPPPRIPQQEPFRLVPHRVRMSIAERIQKQKSRNVLQLVLSVYIILALLCVGHISWLSYEKWNYQKSIDSMKSDVEMIQNTTLRWDSLEPAINPDAYPIEILLRFTQPLPPDGLRLTQFRMEDPKRFTIQGEARDSSFATTFEQTLKSQNTDLQLDPLILTHPDESNPTLVLTLTGTRSPTPLNATTD